MQNVVWYVVFLLPTVSDSSFGLHSYKHVRNTGRLGKTDDNMLIFL